ncbi:uncharacterized protein LOC126737664 [Anthonomus grandis grandis]|uniref:uncharacterized protein LOC126737664 n=1 Tax=Anthonomus grandis grandis TaxID=2921223 RepID=UPI002165EFF8|nr:uncharacterized protein LOC126737664 [Anthonomus grandis grandis]
MQIHFILNAMFEKFLFCWKHKISAVLMACTSLILGITGTIYFSLKKYHITEPTSIASNFLVISIFHIIVSLVLMSGIIWESPILILAYEFIHISVLISLLVFVMVSSKKNYLFWIVLAIASYVLVYWMLCIHLFYRQLGLKVKSSIKYVDRDVYSVCNKLYVNRDACKF